MRNEIIHGQLKLKRIHRIIVDRDDPFMVPIRTIQQDIRNEQRGDRPHENATDDRQGQTPPRDPRVTGRKLTTSYPWKQPRHPKKLHRRLLLLLSSIPGGGFFADSVVVRERRCCLRSHHPCLIGFDTHIFGWMVLFAKQDHDQEFVRLVPDAAVVVVLVVPHVHHFLIAVRYWWRHHTIIFSHNEGFLYNFIEGIFTLPPRLCASRYVICLS